MSLKREYATESEVPEALRSAYVEKDGKFVLDLEASGADDSAKLKATLEKERKDRQTIEKTLQTLKTQLGDADPVKAREAMKTLAELEEKALLGDLPPTLQAKVDELVSKRVERIAADHKTREEALVKENGTHKTKLEELLIDNAIRSAAGKAGVRQTAVEDAVLFGKTVWRLKDGNPVPMKGEEILYGKEPNKPMTMDEWMSERATDRAHWFEPHSGGAGGGATGSTTPRVSGSAVTLDAEKAKDPAVYRAAKERAAKEGVELVLTS